MAETSQSIAKRWTPKLVKGGWTPISTYFLDNYHRLKPSLTSLEAMLIIHLIRHKWDERHPHPTFATLSRRMGVSATATRNHARSLEKKRFLNRLVTQGSPNEFDLTPLFDALERLHMATEALDEPPPPIRRIDLNTNLTSLHVIPNPRTDDKVHPSSENLEEP